MKNSDFFYEIQYSENRDAVWIHSSDGSTVGRFGKLGIDLHNTVTEQLAGAPECRLCTHGKPTKAEWNIFISRAKEWWNVDVDYDAFDTKFLREDGSATEQLCYVKE